jgi:CBS domain-containing protein
MEIGELCSREVCVVRPDEPLAQAVRQMQRFSIGTVVVVEHRGKLLYPIGILTDRDVLRGQIKRQTDLFALNVEDVMTTDPLTLAESSGLAEGLSSMRARGVRRAPVVASTGELVGIVSIDDLLPAVAAELRGLAQLMAAHRGPEIP